MVDCVGDGGRNTDSADLARALGTERVHDLEGPVHGRGPAEDCDARIRRAFGFAVVGCVHGPDLARCRLPALGLRSGFDLLNLLQAEQELVDTQALSKLFTLGPLHEQHATGLFR